LERNELETTQLEKHLVSLCRQLVTRRWQSMVPAPSDAAPSPLEGTAPPQLMNALHLAAALGLLRVTCTLLNWRLENTSPLLDAEVGPNLRPCFTESSPNVNYCCHLL